MKTIKAFGIILFVFIAICAIVGISTSLFPKASNTIIPGLLLSICVIPLYFLPTIRAYKIKHPQKDPIFLINLFLGWTFIGWFIALVWSFSAQPSKA